MERLHASWRVRRLAAALTVGVAALAAAGGGLSGTGAKAAATTASGSGSPEASGHNAMLAFAQCIRSHGVPDFPDPTGGQIMMQQKNGKPTVNGVPLNVSSSTFHAAQQACRRLLPAATGTAGSANAKKLQKQALAFAQCMRAHGVANFPDPKVSSNGIQIRFGGNMSSPAFQAAQKACSGLMPHVGGGG